MQFKFQKYVIYAFGFSSTFDAIFFQIARFRHPSKKVSNFILCPSQIKIRNKSWSQLIHRPMHYQDWIDMIVRLCGINFSGLSYLENPGIATVSKSRRAIYSWTQFSSIVLMISFVPRLCVEGRHEFVLGVVFFLFRWCWPDWFYCRSYPCNYIDYSSHHDQRLKGELIRKCIGGKQ